MYNVSFCDPFKDDIVDLGKVESSKVMELFEKTPWQEYLKQMENTDANKIHYSPTLQFEDVVTNHAISLSADGGNQGIEWTILYIRPKIVKYLFGLLGESSLTDITEIVGRSEADVRKCIEALLKEDYQFLNSFVL
ncbi:MAG: hypothetical protein LBN24_10305 [Mediterranea sp.]|jgi:hypothetical protein|nr:hypothetical protein [Mediterranea sp.]